MVALLLVPATAAEMEPEFKERETPEGRDGTLLEDIEACLQEADWFYCMVDVVRKHGCIDEEVRACRVCYAFHIERGVVNPVQYFLSHSPKPPSYQELVRGHGTAIVHGYGDDRGSAGIGRHVIQFDQRGVPSCE